MFSVFNRNVSFRELMCDFHDVHSHLLPGVDDGCGSLEHSIKLMSELESMGVKAVYCTPHVIADTYPLNNNTYLRGKFAEFKSSISKRSQIDVRLGAEYLVDDIFLNNIESDPLVMGSDHLLIEFTMGAFMNNVFDTIYEIELRGYTPIIAHPERYEFIASNKDNILEHLIDVGCKLQLNLLSVSGWHGSMPQKIAHDFLDRDIYNFTGSDIHSLTHIAQINKARIPVKYAAKIERLMQNNRKLFSETV